MTSTGFFVLVVGILSACEATAAFLGIINRPDWKSRAAAAWTFAANATIALWAAYLLFGRTK